MIARGAMAKVRCSESENTGARDPGRRGDGSSVYGFFGELKNLAGAIE